MITFDKYPGGKKKAVTMSYDDGMIFDKKLIEIFDKYGIKGTFHINSGFLGVNERKIKAEEIKEVYKNHEVAIHGVEHATLTKLKPQSMIGDVLEDRRALEKLMGYPVVGMSYANGAFSDVVCDVLKACGVVYSRTTQSTGKWGVPENFLKWHPTCHHKDSEANVERFVSYTYGSGHLLYIWGHSYEFDNDNNWDLIERVCQKLGAGKDIWFATNIEIYNYVKACESIILSVDEDIMVNPTNTDIWFTKDGETMKIEANETLRF